jgi:DNA polymerase I-like protein with 3'-5' exonuclease and polymerase domains
MKIIRDLPPQQEPNTWIGLDIEMFNLNPKQLHRPISGEFACLSVATDKDTVYIVEDQVQLPMTFSRLRDTVAIYQNAQFDITHLRRWVDIPPTKKLWDTMYIERILYGGYYDMFGLEHLARRHLNIKMDKSLQKSFEDATELSDEQIEYSALDASITLQVCHAQRKVMRKKDFNIWAKVDRPALWAYLDFMGFAINVAGWKGLADKYLELATKIEETFDYNPRSPKQVKERLIATGFKGLPNTQEKTLRTFISKYPDADASDIAQSQLEYKKFQKRHSTYGMNFIEHFVERDIQFDCDMIRCSYWITGAETGRTSSSNPNMQNIPKRDTKEYRQCFIARPNNALIIADYSAQEPSILAYVSQDKKLIEIINSGKDIYIETQKLSKLFQELTRDKMKSIVLGTNYGMSEYGLKRELGCSLAEAKRLIREYFHIFSGVASWVIKQQKKKDYVETLLGRRIWLNRYSSQVEENAVNAPIQGTADEIGLDVPKQHAKKIAKFTKHHMVSVAESVCPGIKARVDVNIGDNWGSK